MNRIDYAVNHGEVIGASLLEYFPNDPGLVTTFCPGDDRNAADCIAYPGVTLRSDGLVNTDGDVDLSSDTMIVRDAVSGNINPYYYLSGARTITIGEAYGIIDVVDGGVWHMNARAGADIIAAERGGTIYFEPGTDAPIEYTLDSWKQNTYARPYYQAEFIAASDGGSLVMRGGMLASTSIAALNRGGTLSGYGTLASLFSVRAGGTIIPEGLTVRPWKWGYAEDSPTLSRISDGDVPLKIGVAADDIGDDADVQFNVSPQDQGSKLHLAEGEVIAYEPGSFGTTTIYRVRHRGVLEFGDNVTMTINAKRDFYAPSWRSTLIDAGLVPGSAYGDPENPIVYEDRDWGYSTTNFITGSFKTIRRDASDSGIAFADGAIFHPRKNSLLTFTVHEVKEEQWEVLHRDYKENYNYLTKTTTGFWFERMFPETKIYPEIYLTANPAFEDVGLFGNAQSGDGLGVVLKKASDEASAGLATLAVDAVGAAAPAPAPLADLLGTLQFADRDIARREAGALRGDGHATLRLASANFAHQFDTVLRGQVAGMRRLNGGNFVVAPPKTAAKTAGASQLAATSGTGTSWWVAGFGQTGAITGQGAVDRMNYDAAGALFGVSRQIGDDLNFGAAFGYGRMTAKEDEGSGVDGTVNAYGGSAYADYTYGPGYLYAQGGYRWLKNRTDRTILGIEGLEGNNHARYTSKAFSASLEHGIKLTPKSATRVTLIVPSVEYLRLSGARFSEKGGLAALSGKLQSVESLRVGAGLELTQDITTKSGQRFAPYVKAMYKRELGDRDAVAINSFVPAAALDFAAVSRKLDRGLVQWEAGISSPADQNFTISLSYVGQKNASLSNHSVKIALGVKF